MPFSELYELTDVESRDLLTTMAGHALGGWSIKGEVVIEIAERAELKTADFNSLCTLAYSGVVAQMNGGRFGHSPLIRDAEEYEQVLVYARLRLSEIARNN